MQTNDMTLELLDVVRSRGLGIGGHRSRENGMCALEACAWIAGEMHTDRPACVDPLIAEFVRDLNDELVAEHRALLIERIPAMIGTTGTDPGSRRQEILASRMDILAAVMLRVAGLDRDVSTEQIETERRRLIDECGSDDAVDALGVAAMLREHTVPFLYPDNDDAGDDLRHAYGTVRAGLLAILDALISTTSVLDARHA